MKMAITLECKGIGINRGEIDKTNEAYFHPRMLLLGMSDAGTKH